MACPKCGVVARMTVDHVVKPRDGGTNDKRNLRYMCGPCNSKRK
jgi:5-methylcytosine-specific restriction endonuclease McrA